MGIFSAAPAMETFDCPADSITSSTVDCIRTITRCIILKGRYPSAFSSLSRRPAGKTKQTDESGNRINSIILDELSQSIARGKQLRC